MSDEKKYTIYISTIYTLYIYTHIHNVSNIPIWLTVSPYLLVMVGLLAHQTWLVGNLSVIPHLV